ncbi:MAG: oxidoreductase [Candidatus Bathyarchaeia archaeon]
MSESIRHGLLIDYEYCTGCFACQVACAQEYRRPNEIVGMQVIEVIQKLPDGKPYLCFIPFPTELCSLCAGRVRSGLEPACVKHCMAKCIKHGPVEYLAEEMSKKGRMVLWAPH